MVTRYANSLGIAGNPVGCNEQKIVVVALVIVVVDAFMDDLIAYHDR